MSVWHGRMADPSMASTASAINLALPLTKAQEAFGRLNKYVINA